MTDENDRLATTLKRAEQQYEQDRASGATELREFTETSIARRFARQVAHTMIYNHTSRVWLTWGGAVWTDDKVGFVIERIRLFVETERVHALDPNERADMGRVNFIMAVEKICRSDPLLAVEQSMFDTDPWLLGTPGGVVDLRTGKMQPGRPSDFITMQTAVTPAPTGTPAPHWQAFLKQVTQDDCELQSFLQRWVGYCLSGDVSEEVLTFLYGDGGNGKGVFVRTITGILGSYAVAQPIDAFTAGTRLSAEYYRAAMAGARLVTASETERGRDWAEGQIKELTGNEAPVSARHPHGRPFTYKPQFKLQFVGNHAPRLKGRSPAMQRRLRVIPLTYKPKLADRGLKDRLQDEWPAILRWIIDGCINWQSHGLGTATVIQQASDRYFEQQDAFGRWLAEACIIDPTLLTRPGQLLANYQVWCQTNGETALSASEFAEERDRTPGMILKTREGVRWVIGVGFKVTPAPRWDN